MTICYSIAVARTGFVSEVRNPLRLALWRKLRSPRISQQPATVSANNGDRMYRSKNCQSQIRRGGQLEFPDFYLPFSGYLDPENRWVALARLVSRELAEEI